MKYPTSLFGSSLTQPRTLPKSEVIHCICANNWIYTTQNGSNDMVYDCNYINSNERRLTLMPNVKTVTIILKTRASESCHSADTALSPIVPLTTSDVSAVTFSLKSLHTPSQTTSWSSI